MLPEDLLAAYLVFMSLATQHGYSFAGMMISKDPPVLVGIGNVTEKGDELATLLRKYAELLDDKTAAGLVRPPFFQDPN